VADHELGAVVLSGGGGARLGGADKASIEVGGRTLLEHALEALVDVTEVVVVGPEVPTSRPVTFTREDPPGGGPAAGHLAGVRRVVRKPARGGGLAVVKPRGTPQTVRRLVAADREDGATLVGEDGRAQHLCAVYSVEALVRAAHDLASGYGAAMRDLVAGLDLQPVAAAAGETQDLDTWQDLAELREVLGD
jgi:molybdopterin-guanine dinucleotide biosynthesis protein A